MRCGYGWGKWSGCLGRTHKAVHILLSWSQGFWNSGIKGSSCLCLLVSFIDQFSTNMCSCFLNLLIFSASTNSHSESGREKITLQHPSYVKISKHVKISKLLEGFMKGNFYHKYYLSRFWLFTLADSCTNNEISKAVILLSMPYKDTETQERQWWVR